MIVPLLSPAALNGLACISRRTSAIKSSNCCSTSLATSKHQLVNPSGRDLSVAPIQSFLTLTKIFTWTTSIPEPTWEQKSTESLKFVTEMRFVTWCNKLMWAFKIFLLYLRFYWPPRVTSGASLHSSYWHQDCRERCSFATTATRQRQLRLQSRQDNRWRNGIVGQTNLHYHTVGLWKGRRQQLPYGLHRCCFELACIELQDSACRQAQGKPTRFNCSTCLSHRSLLSIPVEIDCRKDYPSYRNNNIVGFGMRCFGVVQVRTRVSCFDGPLWEPLSLTISIVVSRKSNVTRTASLISLCRCARSQNRCVQRPNNTTTTSGPCGIVSRLKERWRWANSLNTSKTSTSWRSRWSRKAFACCTHSSSRKQSSTNACPCRWPTLCERCLSDKSLHTNAP